MRTSYENTGTETIGGLPLIASYLKKLNIINVIDEYTNQLRSNHRRYSHGKTCFVLILYLLFRPHVMYKIEEWVRETTYLRVLFPDIKSEYFNDDRIGDTLDALYMADTCNMFTQQSINISQAFNLDIKETNADFSNFSVYGDFDCDEGINITYGGAPKSKRTDLRQFAIDVAVEAKDGVPIYHKISDGNSADVSKYPSVWRGIRETLGNSDFIMIGDCKLSSENNLLTISRGNGYYIAPQAMYSTAKEDLRRLVIVENRKQELIREELKDNLVIKRYKGFETTDSIADPKTNQPYYLRKIYVWSLQLEKTELDTFCRHLEKAKNEINEILKNINSKKYDSEEKITESIKKIFSKYKIDPMIVNYTINKTSTVVQKKIGKGRVGKNTKFEDIVIDIFSLEIVWNDKLIEEEKKLCGYFVLVTNKTSEELSTREVFDLYKKQWKIERIFERLKGHLQVLPIRLNLPRRIEGLMYLLMTCAQVFTLIDRTAKISLEEAGEEIVGLSANKKGLARPKTEAMLDAIRNISLIYKLHDDGEISVKLTGANEFVCKILKITNVDQMLLNDEYISNMLDQSEKFDRDDFHQSIMIKFSNNSN